MTIIKAPFSFGSQPQNRPQDSAAQHAPRIVPVANNTTRPIVQFIYEQAFMQLSLGYASAASQVLFAVMLIGVSVQLWLERDRRMAR